MKVSCIIPAYNEAQRITYILEFLLSYSRIDEVVVVDDGSSDSTAKVVQDFIDQHRCSPRYKLIINSKNQGKGRAVAVGLTQAKGDVIVFCDADIFSIDASCFDKLIQNLSPQNRMVVLDTSFIRRFPLSITGMVRLWSGQRACYRSDLLQLDWTMAGNYALESWLNAQYLNQNWGALYVFAYGADSVLQFEKQPKGKGLDFYMRINKEIFGRFSVGQLLWQRLNSPIQQISFAYFVRSPVWVRIALAPLTLSIESIHGFWLCIAANLYYLNKFLRSH